MRCAIVATDTIINDFIVQHISIDTLDVARPAFVFVRAITGGNAIVCNGYMSKGVLASTSTDVGRCSKTRRGVASQRKREQKGDSRLHCAVLESLFN